MENPYAKYVNSQPQGENPYAKYVAAPEGVTPNPFSFARDAVESGQVEKPTGFNARMNQDYEKLRQQVQKVGETDYTLAEKGLQTLGAGAGYLLDTTGNVIGSGARYVDELAPELTEPIKQGFQSFAKGASELGQDLGETDAGQFVGRQLIKGQEFLEENPRLTSNAGAAFNITSAVPIARGVVNAVSLVPKELPIQAVKFAAKPITGTAKGIALRAKGFNAAAGDDLKNIVKTEAGKTTQAYKAVDKTGTVVGSESTNTLMNKINNKLMETDLDAEFQPKTIAALRVLKNNIESEVGGAGQIGLGKLDQFRRLLGRATAPEDKLVAAQIRDVLGDHLNSLADVDLVGGTKQSIAALSEARAQAAKTFAVEKIAKIIRKADGDDNAIRKGFAKFIGDDKNLRGLNEAEISALVNASKNTGGQAIEKFIGRFGIDSKGGVLPTLAASATAGGGALLVPAAAPAVVAGTAAKYTRKLAARGDAQKALETILKRELTPAQIAKLPPKEAMQVLKGMSPEMQARVKAAEESLRKGK